MLQSTGAQSRPRLRTQQLQAAGDEVRDAAKMTVPHGHVSNLKRC